MKWTGALISALFLAGCASMNPPPPQTQPIYTFDDQTDFSHYQTFAWASEDPLEIPVDQVLRRGKMQDDLMSAVTAHLEAQGMQRVDQAEQADLLVKMIAGRRVKPEEEVRIVRHDGPLVFTGKNWLGEPRTALAIEMIDSRSGTLVWQVEKNEALQGSMGLARTTNNVRNAANQMLANYPPQD